MWPRQVAKTDRELRDGKANIQTLPSSLSPAMPCALATLLLTEQSLHEDRAPSWVNTLKDHAHGTWNST